jgi:hypothetical protein
MFTTFTRSLITLLPLDYDYSIYRVCRYRPLETEIVRSTTYFYV